MDLRRELDALRDEPERAARPRLSPLLAAPVVAAATVALAIGMGHAVNGLVGIPGEGPLPSGSAGEYAFINTQPLSGDPVSFDHCSPIRVVVNPVDAPEGYDELVKASTQHLEAASRFRFDLVGETLDRRIDHRVSGRDANASDPVLVLWVDATEVDDLAGDVAGAATSQAVSRAPGQLEYVTGAIALDSQSYAEMMVTPEGRESAQQILDHEFAHLVGLDHIENPRELMNPEYVGQVGFGPGDLSGLERLSAHPCGND